MQITYAHASHPTESVIFFLSVSGQQFFVCVPRDAAVSYDSALGRVEEPDTCPLFLSNTLQNRCTRVSQTSSSLVVLNSVIVPSPANLHPSLSLSRPTQCPVFATRSWQVNPGPPQPTSPGSSSLGTTTLSNHNNRGPRGIKRRGRRPSPFHQQYHHRPHQPHHHCLHLSQRHSGLSVPQQLRQHLSASQRLFPPQ